MAAEQRYAFVTLLTSDTYLPGALTLAASLRDLHPRPAQHPQVDFELVCIVTPEIVDVSTVKLLRRAYDLVVGVEVLEQQSDKGLRLLGRLDLNTVLTKLHVFRLTQYSKIIFLDADVLPIRPLSHLFTLPHEFSAVPDVGWPDIFNSGVLVLSPGDDKFTELNDLLKAKGSWDGGDQGILNEWRGDDWHRLSFTYNTTPTAAYTYAPAYERFGSKISAIHFIGPNKPWHSIPYRAPFSESQPTGADAVPQAYDYNSLLDRWFAVYDKHFRSQAIVPEHEFEVKRYISAWDEQTGTGAEWTDSAALPIGGALGLEDLRQLALRGSNSTSLIGDSRFGEGDYQSLPLEGRVDLMRPPLQPEDLRPSEEDLTPTGPPSQAARTDTLPTPGPSEVPPSPHLHPVSLPSEAHAAAAEHIHYSLPSEKPAAVTEHSHYSLPSERPAEHVHQEAPRPPSPPMLIWNPAINPPPNDPPAPDAFPTDTYFPNAWDQPHQHQPSHHSPSHPQQQAPSSGGFFEPPPPAQIPQMLKQQGHYEHVIGRQDEIHDPDQSKVKSIFPWEQKPRHLPGRVFPTGDALSPSAFVSPGQTAQPLQDVAPATPSPPPTQAFSPTRGLPTSLSYANAWDTVPSIQKYASKLVRPPRSTVPQGYVDDGSWRHSGSWAAQSEASSQDGDVEDEEDEDQPQAQQDSDEDDSGSRRSRRESSSSNISASYVIKGKKKEYRVRGVQTISPQLRSQGVQAVAPKKQSAPEAKTSVPKPEISRSKGQWTPVASNTLPPLTVHDVSIGVEPSITTAAPTSGAFSHPLDSASTIIPPGSGPQSPREFTHSTPSATASQALQNISASSPARVGVDRHPSESSTASDLSSLGPVSPPEGAPLTLTGPGMTSPSRKPGRVFDPARGVDVFKKGSEEVLARFLRMGSWENEGSR